MSGAPGGNGGEGNQNQGGAGDGKPAGGGNANSNEGFKPVTYSSQAELDAAFATRADQARRAALKDLPEGVSLEQVLEGYKAAQAAEDAKKDEVTRERDARLAAEAKAQRYEQQQARDKLAGEVAGNVKIGDKAIPASLLRGTTKEELEASAQEIKSFVESLGPAPRAPGYNPFQGGGSAAGAGEGSKEDPLRTYLATGSF